MTAEQQIAAVEAALDRNTELIADAREAFQVSAQQLWEEFSYGILPSLRVINKAIRFYHKLVAAIGETQANAIDEEELVSFCASGGFHPEVSHVFMHGTDEEKWSFPGHVLGDKEADDAAIAEWIADRKHQKNREDYARAFYGEKP